MKMAQLLENDNPVVHFILLKSFTKLLMAELNYDDIACKPGIGFFSVYKLSLYLISFS